MLQPSRALCAEGGFCFAPDRSLSFLFILRASGEQFQQHGIALAFEFFNRAVAGFFQNPFKKRLLNLRAEFRYFPEIFPPCRQRARKLRQEMLASKPQTPPYWASRAMPLTGKAGSFAPRDLWFLDP